MRFEDWDIALKNLENSSIRIQLLYALLVPLSILWLITAGIAYYLAVWFANDEYDHHLLNSADSVAARLRSDGTRILVDLPPAAQAILRHNERDKFYYQIIKTDGTRISGDAVIPGPYLNLSSKKPVLRYAELAGVKVRVARIRVDIPNYPEQPVLVQVAETLNSRQQFVDYILLAILIPQIVLIGLGAIAVWLGVSKGLAPLKSLETALARRSQIDLTPVSSSIAPVEVRPLVDAINNLLNRLAEDIEGQKRFVANAAHHFRTPLAALKTYIYYAKRLPADGEMNEALDKIDVSTERMTRLSNKLLALARAEPPNRSEKFQPVDLNYVVSEATASCVAEATKRSVELSFSGSPSPAIVRGDAHSLIELATNLVENAVFYTPTGGDISVSVSNGENVRLTVCDNGPGIPVEERTRVFERFYRILGGEIPGSGLGLSIVKEIAIAHNASVAIDNATNGKGTLVTVTFASAKT